MLNLFRPAVFLAIAILCFVYARAQTQIKRNYNTIYIDTSALVTSGTGIGDSDTWVTKWDNGTLEITKGDSLSAIKLLWLRLEESQKKNLDFYIFVHKSVKFTNTVPDYLKTSKNKEWIKYYVELKRLGYEVSKQ